MSRYLGPVEKKKRKYGLVQKEEAVKGSFRRKTSGRRLSEYGTRLLEKQKIKFIYGVQERQFKRYMDLAFKSKGNTGERLLQLLETRLDRIVLLSGLAKTNRQARQLVTHGHVILNGHKASIPSMVLKEGDVVTLTAKTLDNALVKENMKDKVDVPAWLQKEGPAIKVKRLPKRDDIDLTLNEQLVVEYYSR